jgi:hypothetical protein
MGTSLGLLDEGSGYILKLQAFARKGLGPERWSGSPDWAPFPPRRCERSEAIHSAVCGDMDCFAALAMTATVRRVGKAQRAHHQEARSMIDGGHVANAPLPTLRTSPGELDRFRRMGGAKRYTINASARGDGFRFRSTHPTQSAVPCP